MKLSKQQQIEWQTRIAASLKQTAFRFVDEHSGLGGAITYFAEAKDNDGLSVPFVVKIGTKQQLQKESEALTEAKKKFNNVCDQIGAPLIAGEEMAVIMGFAGGSSAVTFSEFFERTDEHSLIISAIEALFGHALRRDKFNVTPTNENALELYCSDFSASPSLSAKFDRFNYSSENLPDWCSQIGKDVRKPSSLIYSHGDLHGKNVLISNNQPYLIDFGASGPKHVMCDLAKFEREIRLTLFLKNKDDTITHSDNFENWLLAWNRTNANHVPSEYKKLYYSVECIRSFAKRSLRFGEDWKFDYYSALLIQYIRAASNDLLEENMRLAALKLAKQYQELIKRKIRLNVSGGDDSARKRSLWRLAYSFLRLDQLPSGGWGKSLPQWMEAIWEGDGGTITRSPEMRTSGGTDFTCGSFYNYVGFTERVLAGGPFLIFAQNNPVPRALTTSLIKRIDHEGEMNTGVAGKRLPNTKVNLRHTAMGMISLLLCGKPNGFGILSQRELVLTAKYVTENISHWQQDKSYPFGMFAALCKLLELLQSEDGVHELIGYGEDRELLINALKSHLSAIGRSLIGSPEYEPLPKNTHVQSLIPGSFRPYGGFWRMERAGFLMYLPLLLSDDSDTFVSQIENDNSLRNALRLKLFPCLHELMQEVQCPFDPDNAVASLVRYHRGIQNNLSPRDWGLSAQLAVLLHRKAIRNIVIDRLDYSDDKLDALTQALENALIATFDKFHDSPELFKYTNGLSFSSALSLLRTGSVLPRDLIALDSTIEKLVQTGITEQSLHDFVNAHILNPKDAHAQINSAAVRDLLLDKLQPAEHTTTEKVITTLTWERIKRDTISFYNHEGGVDYIRRYGGDPKLGFVNILDELFASKSIKGMKALDLACGPGQYAKLLQDRGFEVELYDASEKMLGYAAKLIDKDPVPAPRDYFDLPVNCKDAEFDLIFACAMIVHVPLQFTPFFYREFYRILKPGGALFVNFKVADHSIISLGGRFFEYYREQDKPRKMLEAAGFKIFQEMGRWNDRTLQNTPRKIHWVNIYCVKPDETSNI